MNCILEYEELQNILDTMIVPRLRKDDLMWLKDHLGVINKDHPEYLRAMSLIDNLIMANGGYTECAL